MTQYLLDHWLQFSGLIAGTILVWMIVTFPIPRTKRRDPISDWMDEIGKDDYEDQRWV